MSEGQPEELLLRVVAGPNAGDCVPLTLPGITIGREHGNTLSLADRRVSRYHARIEPHEDAWMLVDLDSTNGTRLNGLRVVRGGVIAGDYIYVGDSVISVQTPEPPAPVSGGFLLPG